jgi:mono/diheme cytochrome c family protein
VASAAVSTRAVLDRYCVTCHNQRLRTGDLALDTLDPDNVAAAPDAWESVVRKLRTGAMPPPGMPRPDDATLSTVRTSLSTALDRSATPNPGRPLLHRLNRANSSA